MAGTKRKTVSKRQKQHRERTRPKTLCGRKIFGKFLFITYTTPRFGGPICLHYEKSQA